MRTFNKIKADTSERCAVKYFVQNVLGLSLEPISEKKLNITPEIKKLIAEREKARKARDWAKADALRDKLKELGFDLKDKKI